MPVIRNIKNVKFFNQLKNGVAFDQNTGDFTPNLLSVIEFIRIVFDIDVTWYADASQFDPWQVYAGRIVRSSGNFHLDGMTVGDKVEFYNDWINRDSNPPEFSAIIDFIDTDGFEIEFTVIGTQTTTGSNTNIGIWANPGDAENHLQAAFLRFGLNDNDETFNTLSKVTNNQQRFFAEDISRTPLTFSPLNVQGDIKDWVTGAAEVALKETGVQKNIDTFQVRHTFLQLPYYRAGELANLQSKQIIDPYKGDNSLKYAFELGLRKDKNNIDSEKAVIISDVLGVAGWFEENFNGFPSDYTINSIVYKDPSLNVLGSIAIEGQTTITINLGKNSGSIPSAQKVGVFISFLPLDDAEYKDTTATDYLENFLLDSIFHQEGTAETVASGIFKSCDTALSAGDILITAVVEYTTAQAQKILNGNYVVWVLVEDGALLAPVSDRVSLIADTNEYNQAALVSGLMDFDKFVYHRHESKLGVDPGVSSLIEWNEDGLLLEFDFYLDLSKNTVLTELKFSLLAVNTVTGNSFELDTRTINLSGVVISGGIQQIEIDTNRGYILKSGDQFNNVKVTTGAKVGDLQHYTGSIGQKVKWQDWISNLQADPVFFDAAKNQDNLNFLSSNYSNLNDYEIMIVSEAKLTGEDGLGNNVESTFIFEGGDINVFDFGVPDDGAFSADIFTLDPDSLIDLEGAILKNKDTLFKAVWVNASLPDVPDVLFAIHMTQDNVSIGDDDSQISSINDRLIGDILKPVAGESFLKVLKVGDNLETTCLIDHTKLKGKNIDLEARIQTVDTLIFNWISGVCEVDGQLIIPDPPTAPEFCVGLPVASGGAGIFDKKILITFTGWIYIVADPQGQVDKFELLLNNETTNVTGTSGTTAGGNGGPFDNVDTGADEFNNKIWDTPFDANNERTLPDNPRTLETAVWFIGNASTPKPPKRITEWEADTGLTFNRFLGVYDQVIWIPQLVKPGDEVIIRASGYFGTLYTYKIYCDLVGTP